MVKRDGRRHLSDVHVRCMGCRQAISALEAELAEWKRVFPNEEYIRSLEARAMKAEAERDALGTHLRALGYGGLVGAVIERIEAAATAELAYRRSYDTGDFSSFQKIMGEWKFRADAAEAEVERLRAYAASLDRDLVQTDEGPDERTEDC